MPEQHMRNHLAWAIPFLLLMAWHSVPAKTIAPPVLPAEKAIAIARQYVTEQHIDVSNHFVGAVEYINAHSEYKRPFWRIEWRLLAGTAKGGQLIVLVYGDGSAERGYGE